MRKTRRQIAREKATIGIYQNLLVDSSLEEIKEYLNGYRILRESEESMAFSQWIVETTLKNKNSYIKLLESHLKKGWTFARLGTFEQAILLSATCELLESDLPKQIVINEAVILAKEFCDNDSYKYINGVLTQVI